MPSDWGLEIKLAYVNTPRVSTDGHYFLSIKPHAMSRPPPPPGYVPYDPNLWEQPPEYKKWLAEGRSRWSDKVANKTANPYWLLFRDATNTTLRNCLLQRLRVLEQTVEIEIESKKALKQGGTGGTGVMKVSPYAFYSVPRSWMHDNDPGEEPTIGVNIKIDDLDATNRWTDNDKKWTQTGAKTLFVELIAPAIDDWVARKVTSYTPSMAESYGLKTLPWRDMVENSMSQKLEYEGPEFEYKKNPRYWVDDRLAGDPEVDTYTLTSATWRVYKIPQAVSELDKTMAAYATAMDVDENL